jgi:transcriptional regulator with XRE-family HTH domain
MSTKAVSGSSSSTQSARKKPQKTRAMPHRQDDSVTISEPVIVTSRRSPSKMKKILRSPEFRLALDNDLSYRVATNAIHLRRFRGESQAEVARAMGTSQPKVARIESGDDNITLETLRKLVDALRGRIDFSMMPREMQRPRLPDWWAEAENDFSSESAWQVWGVCVDEGVTDKRLGVAWVTKKQATLIDGPIEPVLLNEQEVA